MLTLSRCSADMSRSLRGDQFHGFLYGHTVEPALAHAHPHFAGKPFPPQAGQDFHHGQQVIGREAPGAVDRMVFDHNKHELSGSPLSSILPRDTWMLDRKKVRNA